MGAPGDLYLGACLRREDDCIAVYSELGEP